MAADFPSQDKTINADRAAFRADFERAAAAQEDAECLTPEEILSLQAGAELDPVANEHLKRCVLCSALREAIQVDPIRMQEFRRAARRAQPADAMQAPAGRNQEGAKFEWRLPAAAVTAFASLAVLIWTNQYRTVPLTDNHAAMARLATPLEIPNARANHSLNGSSRTQIALQPPSGPPFQFVSTAPTTVKDVAPQVATAAVLSRSAITLPVNAPPQLSAEVKQEALNIVYLWLASPSNAKVSFTDSAKVAYLPAEKSYRLKLSGGSVSVPEVALEDGQAMKTKMLGDANFHQAIASLSEESHTVSMKLGDGYTVRIASEKSKMQ